jgi:hypothetical protein
MVAMVGRRRATDPGRYCKRCNGKTDCTPAIEVDHLGDPVPNFGKEFAVSMTRRQELPGDASFGNVLKLRCPRGGED